MIVTPVRRNAAVLVFASCVLLVTALSRGACAAESAVPLSAPETTAPAAPSGAVAGAPADVAPAPVAAAPATEEVANPYGLAQLWSQGDPVARGTMVVLLIMSIGTWYIAISKLIEQTRVLAQARAADATFWNTGSVEESIGRLKESNAFRQIAERGLSATEHHEGSLVERIDLHTWVTMSIQRSVDAITARLQRGLAFLATVGSTAPFIGLFGTVWGIYHALVAIGLAGQASIDKVAGPVGEALIMTAIGLFVAVPAVLCYNYLVRRNKVINERLRSFASDLQTYLITNKK
jgi:biopolymer transport protein ExbB